MNAKFSDNSILRIGPPNYAGRGREILLESSGVLLASCQVRLLEELPLDVEGSELFIVQYSGSDPKLYFEERYDRTPIVQNALTKSTNNAQNLRL